MTYPSRVDSWIGFVLGLVPAPALSLDRLEITYGGSRTTLVSPRDRAAFLSDLTHAPLD